ncbi:NPL4-like protein, forms a complex with UFD1 and CDC48 [Guillardia theta CCMP2712]|uniref:NPL4-like protein, forms a complex with UFD1 and CDC48 n=1 Tax=Guillardia theta (strain CCMP2712) TaxID=905079 RepID=L1JXH4_GUITC|nr:NPL4-like protein, forms a complex with UFD1 and CDC48 [Guillardia theta CCMP2712]EKX52773.1 NPL4-like protein, forms a complex with UFD1 and CDC48 [Guillardia theta CCMP2712]|mmetsp:Transcript_33523/g.105571  ORF Transcript_33523/g.105571 Transcript_33523/m.105571 type:complete len:657 (-) Transcript_33523:67-2037(-)|eukprot:XP_005839753.1 NPL4-like protein, forms a complex with UFD1 and CDC48 [Guillardia theta CCMP2712]
MIVRIQTREGQARVEVDPSETLEALAAKLQQQLPTIKQFKLSRDPSHKDYLGPAEATLSSLRIQHGDRIFAQHEESPPSVPHEPEAMTHMVGNSLSGEKVVEILDTVPREHKKKISDIVLDQVDLELTKMDGREKLKSTSRRSFGDESIDTMAVEPYDERLLKEKDVKLMSFHAYLRKLKSHSGGGKFSELKRHDFGSYGEAGGKTGTEKGWGERTVSMSRLPKPMTLDRQKYRHVDRVEIEDPQILDKFLDAWRQTGAMRYGYLYGTYEVDTNVPLGIKAVVKAIYEPPQECAADGVNMLRDPYSDAIDSTAAMLGLVKVGWIFIDLEVMADDHNKYVCSRGKDTYFLRSNECIIAARLQNMNPSKCLECDDLEFGSKFVTVVVTGNEKNELDYVAYQVSQQGMDLERAEGILEYTAKPNLCRVAQSTPDRYVPAIFYQDVSEFGNKMVHEAKPYFPVDYLVVSVNGPTFPQQANPLFKRNFPIENRMYAPQTLEALKAHLNSPDNKPFRPTGQLKTISDFHLIVYLATHPGLFSSHSDEGLRILCEAVKERDSNKASEFMQSPAWQNVLRMIDNDKNLSSGDTEMAGAEFGTSIGAARSGAMSSSRPATASSAAQYEEQADQLEMMGFDRNRALEILNIVHGNIETAIEMLSGS